MKLDITCTALIGFAALSGSYVAVTSGLGTAVMMGISACGAAVVLEGACRLIARALDK